MTQFDIVRARRDTAGCESVIHLNNACSALPPRVVVDATVQAPSHGGYALSFKGGKIAMDQEGVVQAIANRIMPLVE